MPGNCCKQEKDCCKQGENNRKKEKDRCKQKKQQLQAENDNDTTVETLKQKTARGLFWGGMNTMVQQVIGLLFGIILGRLLAPSDYGMMAIISVFSLVAVALQDSGFKVALANEKAPTHADYNAVFWFNILMGIALYAALFLSAPLIGRWYNTPQVVPLCRYAFLSIVVASMGTAQSAWLFKNLRAKQIAKASMAAMLLWHALAAPLLRYRLALFLKDILPFALLPPPPARARGWRAAIRGFFYPFIFAWHCSQFDME